MISSPIVPAIIPQSERELRDFAVVMASASELHVDVVDGAFVPFTSWPYTPAGRPADCFAALEAFSLEVDLMVEDPLSAARAWLAAGADLLVFHVETITVEAFAKFANETSVTVGISANNATPFSTLVPYLVHADYVQVMGIAEIGSQGQPFDERAISRIADIRESKPMLAISLDGSVNAGSLPRLLSLALDRYIMGSAITKAADPVAAYAEFTRIALLSSTGEA